MPAYDAIGFLSGAGIISGYQDGNFGPTDTLKRGQATKMLVLWQGVTPVTAQSSFPDLDDAYGSYVETASEKGWITGYANGRFKPYDTLSRQQMAIIMVRAMGWEDEAKQLSADDVDNVLKAFPDRASISDVVAETTPALLARPMAGATVASAAGQLGPSLR